MTAIIIPLSPVCNYCLVMVNSSLVPSPFEKENGPGIYCMSGDPRKTGESGIIAYSSVYHPQLYIHGCPCTGHYGNVTSPHGKAGACMCNVYQTLSLLNSNTVGTMLRKQQ